MSTTAGQTLTHYELLKIPSSASLSEIRQAYLWTIKSCHPDKNMTLSPSTQQTELAREVIQAYEVLKDPCKRMEYDSQLMDKYARSQPGWRGGAFVGDSEEKAEWEAVDLSQFTMFECDNELSDLADDSRIIQRFVFPCRCGGQFLITNQQMNSQIDVVGCDGCSLRVKVEFECFSDPD